MDQLYKEDAFKQNKISQNSTPILSNQQISTTTTLSKPSSCKTERILERQGSCLSESRYIYEGVAKEERPAEIYNKRQQ